MWYTHTMEYYLAINKMERQPKIQGKIFANAVNDKGLSPKYIHAALSKKQTKNQQSSQKNELKI